MTAAAISGYFADYRLVKSRSVLQLVIEVPVEQQGAAFAALGYPLPGTEIPVAVARMNSPAGSHPQPNRKGTTVRAEANGPQPKPSTPAGELQRQRYAAMSPAEQAVTRAALLPKDERFRAWIPQQEDCKFASVTPFDIASEHEAEDYIRWRCCDRGSRKLIAEVQENLDRFLAMETEFKMDVGELARPR